MKMTFVQKLKGKMMADLIDRQAAIDALNDYCENKCVNRWCFGCQYEVSKYVLKALPSAQPEIVRCKNCKWWNEFYRECQSPNWDTKTDDYFIVPAGFFCGWGERKDDGRPD